MSGFYTEADYENSIIELFQNMGYRYVYGPDVDRDFNSPLYEEELKRRSVSSESDYAEDAIADALFKLKTLKMPNWFRRTLSLWTTFSMESKCATSSRARNAPGLVYLVDYKNPDNNSFIVANQWTFVVEQATRRPDVLLFLNGLPVVLVELKSPSREETDASEAYTQISQLYA